MKTTRAFQMATRMGQDLLDYGPDRSRLLIRMTRLLAQGHPVEANQVEKMIADLGIAQDEGNEFLRCITERDAEDRIVGIAGLSLNDHPHRFVVNDVPLTTWCAEDTLFLPSMLKQTATVESVSPLSKEIIHVTVSPQQVDSVSPADAVLSIVIVSPTEQHMASVEAIWNTFCRQIHFFTSVKQAEQWAAGRDDIEIVTVHEAFQLGQQLWSRVLAYAE